MAKRPNQPANMLPIGTYVMGDDQLRLEALRFASVAVKPAAVLVAAKAYYDFLKGVK